MDQTDGKAATDVTARRRRRVRHTHETETVTQTPDPVDPTPAWPADGSDAELSGLERGLRGLIGSGASQTTPTAAMRARDASRPSPEDLQAAETDLVIVQRHWTPRD